jgi:DNA-binding XRE family transcriptional regulator
MRSRRARCTSTSAIAKQHLEDLEREQPDKPLEQTMPRQRSEGQLAIDSYVGSRVRLRRTLLGISLEKLAEAVGVTARQIRKYERGSDGISASKLYAIATALDVRESFFFENPSPASCKGPMAGADAVLSRESFALMRAYHAIPDPALRHALCEVFKSTARAITGAASDDETVRACPSASR